MISDDYVAEYCDSVKKKLVPMLESGFGDAVSILDINSVVPYYVGLEPSGLMIWYSYRCADDDKYYYLCAIWLKDELLFDLAYRMKNQILEAFASDKKPAPALEAFASLDNLVYKNAAKHPPVDRTKKYIVWDDAWQKHIICTFCQERDSSGWKNYWRSVEDGRIIPMKYTFYGVLSQPFVNSCAWGIKDCK